MSSKIPILVSDFGLIDYQETWDKMRVYTDTRKASSPDLLFVLEHPSVFTQGQAGKPEHVLLPGDIPVVQTDRGGQVTYHGPGQCVLYLMIDIKRRRLGVRSLVSLIEKSIIALCRDYGVTAVAREDAPGVYVEGAKLASVGLRIRKGCSYHGLSLNVDMDLEPFSRINPCGYEGLSVVQLRDLVPGITMDEVKARLVNKLMTALMPVPHDALTVA